MGVDAELITKAQNLIARIERVSDRILVIGRPTPQARKAHRQLVHAVRRHKLVPDGFSMLHTGRDNGDISLHLSDDRQQDRSTWAKRRYRAWHEVTDPIEIEALPRLVIHLPSGLDDMVARAHTDVQDGGAA